MSPLSELQVDGLLGEGGGSKVLLVRHSPSDRAGTPGVAEVTSGGEIVPRSRRDCAEMAAGGGTRGGGELSEFALKVRARVRVRVRVSPPPGWRAAPGG